MDEWGGAVMGLGRWCGGESGAVQACGDVRKREELLDKSDIWYRVLHRQGIRRELPEWLLKARRL